ncbi:MAG: hypothetical protein E6J75_17500 [Deltaproteobacteria bacterium]|nr:MAG: hypothetical protein E6J75_17500 [Deltaproteobacteria bacterium]
MARAPRNPADLVVRSRLREPVVFPDLTERLALKLSSIAHYTARRDALALGDAHEGRHVIRAGDGPVVAQARLMNVFTRYDPDPARRRVTALPPALGLGDAPSRVTELPDLASLVPVDRGPDFVETTTRVWHYGQTDANRHVNGMEYLRAMEVYVADLLHAAGHDLGRLYFARARIVYRKPCFRGEGYRRLAWFRGEAPLVIAGAFVKADDPPHARPAVAVELTVAQHEAETRGAGPE